MNTRLTRTLSMKISYRTGTASLILAGLLSGIGGMERVSSAETADAITQSPESKDDQNESAHNWPAFLGGGHSHTHDGTLPQTWSPVENIRWKSALDGHGQSSPIIWGEQVFLTTVNGPNKEEQIVYCLDLKSGNVLWKKSVTNSSPVKNTFYISRAAPTPVVDSEGIYVLFESGDCLGLTHAGDLKWERKLAPEYGPFVAEFGLGASPCQTSKSVCVLLEHSGPSHLVALSKENGETQWQVDRPSGNSWSSPATFRIEGVDQIVVSSNGAATGYSAENGETLWSLDGLQGNTNVTPIDLHNGQLLIGASAGRQQQGEDLSKKSNGLVQISKRSDGTWIANKVWHNEKLSPSWGSPISKDGLAYWVNRVGVLNCVDLSNGEMVYTHRLKQSCWATPYASKDQIYFFGKEGLCTVIKPGRELQVLSENELFTLDSLPPETTVPEAETSEERRRASANFSGPTLYGIAVANNCIVARIGNQVFAISE